ncbi:hypothetical protein GQ44DRAFT_770871 [Phaeosphaeriaceae sp. PMI808]|nr:hypothetical protein GQ44DRAFT_770871 [Phaeosphaeriaceae sp. PMI808]
MEGKRRRREKETKGREKEPVEDEEHEGVKKGSRVNYNDRRSQRIYTLKMTRMSTLYPSVTAPQERGYGIATRPPPPYPYLPNIQKPHIRKQNNGKQGKSTSAPDHKRVKPSTPFVPTTSSRFGSKNRSYNCKSPPLTASNAAFHGFWSGVNFRYASCRGRGKPPVSEILLLV